MNSVFISICIPTYKRIHFLQRLLESIAIQGYRDFEVIITDDSPDDNVKGLCNQFSDQFPLQYYKNTVTLGTPANWNEAISKAKGQWIKLMHDDDWFSSASGLEKFALAAKEGKADFIFSGYYNVSSDPAVTEKYVITSWHERLLRRTPLNLLKQNFIGHPSTTLIRNNRGKWYQEGLRWVVDIEFYMRALTELSFNFNPIKEPLLNLGIGDTQVTATAFRNPEIEIPENIILLQLIGSKALRKVFAYDYYWRLIRNLSIRNKAVVAQYYKGATIPGLLEKMIAQQRRIPAGWLKIGPISKLTMSITYFWNRLNGRMK